MSDPFAVHEDGSPKDAVAFRDALRADVAKMEILEKEPDAIQIVQGDDIHAFEELIKSIYQVSEKTRIALTVTCASSHTLSHLCTHLQAEKKRSERLNRSMAERTIDAQRVSATVPRDTVQLYAQLRETGLQYGPAFRLLRNVHVPDTTTAPSSS